MPGFLTKAFKKTRSSRSGKKRRPKNPKTKSSELWIQKLEKGTLRADVKRLYGAKGFTKRNHRRIIKSSVIRTLAKRKGVVGQRARAAQTLEKLRGRR